MQHVKFSRFPSALVVASAALVLSVSPGYAQSVSPELETRARDACTQKAQADGFTVQDVVSVAAADADTVNVVLNLNRDGQLYKLTCGYSASQNSAIVGDSAGTTATRTYQPWLNPWLLTLLPLLVGLPLLLAWTKGRSSDEYLRYTGVKNTRVHYGERSEAIVKTDGSMLDIYSGPASSYRVTGNLRNGQRVLLSGRYENSWVELADGGWIPAQYLETHPRFVS
ncbi:SH3 domain-containing protein [Leptolyngbya sp. NK1-12]|uniref:SH3 domain-containing protein n=1 Tax=Leptolyngbya sp. NK1-12 TaxID=2547451 RepID=A0AA96WHL9_9CYAN|nr:SH3 domain-containing protein [Leptolyngbya sp. NK1-12]